MVGDAQLMSGFQSYRLTHCNCRAGIHHANRNTLSLVITCHRSSQLRQHAKAEVARLSAGARWTRTSCQFSTFGYSTDKTAGQPWFGDPPVASRPSQRCSWPRHEVDFGDTPAPLLEPHPIRLDQDFDGRVAVVNNRHANAVPGPYGRRHVPIIWRGASRAISERDSKFESIPLPAASQANAGVFKPRLRRGD
jgi:hypothetical protein